MRWIPLVRIKPGAPWIGITDLGHWVVEGKEDILLADQAPALPILHCLELPVEEFKSTLSEAISRLGGDQMQVQEFPYYSLLDFALRSKMDYWADLALQWLERLPITGAFNDALRAIIKSQWATQKTRHHAQRLLSVSAKIEGGSIKKIEGRGALWCGTRERERVGRRRAES